MFPKVTGMLNPVGVQTTMPFRICEGMDYKVFFYGETRWQKKDMTHQFKTESRLVHQEGQRKRKATHLQELHGVVVGRNYDEGSRSRKR